MSALMTAFEGSSGPDSGRSPSNGSLVYASVR
jgi:hypothetical protein